MIGNCSAQSAASMCLKLLNELSLILLKLVVFSFQLKKKILLLLLPAHLIRLVRCAEVSTDTKDQSTRRSAWPKELFEAEFFP